MLSQNQKDLQMQVARMKQTIEKVLYEDKSLAERICTLFLEQDFTIVLIVTALSKTISIITFAIVGGLGAEAGSATLDHPIKR